MKKDDVIEAVGAEAFAEAAEHAWKHAATTGLAGADYGDYNSGNRPISGISPAPVSSCKLAS